MVLFAQGIYQLRKFICTCIIYSVSYIFPFFQSVGAVVHADQSSISHLLAHWSILTIISTIQYFLFVFHPRMDRYPPEFNLLFMLWLTLPQFNGIEIVNKRYIQPFYSKHEHTIDEVVQDLSNHAKNFALRHSQNLLYQIILSKDGIGMGIFSIITSIISFIDGFDSKSFKVSRKSLQLSQKLLQDFTAIMQSSDGIIMKSGKDISHLRYVNCSIHEINSNYLALKAIDDDSTYLIPIVLIKTMDMFDEGDDGRESIQVTFHKDIRIHGDVNDIYQYKDYILVQSVCLDMPEDDCDAFVGGMQVYTTSVKTRALRKFNRMIEIIKKSTIRKRFELWKYGPKVSNPDWFENSLQVLSNPMQLLDWSSKK